MTAINRFKKKTYYLQDSGKDQNERENSVLFLSAGHEQVRILTGISIAV
jgi:hypothetical protein